MEIFGLKLGKQKTTDKNGQPTSAKKKPQLNLRSQLTLVLKTLARFQTTIIALAVGVLLSITALRMFHYTNPPADPNQVQQNLSKFKQIRIDSKVVQKIQQLQNSAASPSPNIDNGRTNPFSE